MILPSMTDDERGYEAYRVYPTLAKMQEDLEETAYEKFKNRTKYPCFLRYYTEDDRGNKWYFVFLQRSKNDRKKKIFKFACYTVYEIPPKRKENDTNSGKGIIAFNPKKLRDIVMKKKNGEEVDADSFQCIVNITPHAFCRFTSRYLKPKGIEIGFHEKVARILFNVMHFDMFAGYSGDKSAEKHLKEGQIQYDWYLLGGGMLRGMIQNGIMMKFNTYISDDMMFDNQLERRDEIKREYYEWKRKKIYV